MAHIGGTIYPEVKYKEMSGGYLMPVDWAEEDRWMEKQLSNEPNEGIKNCFLIFPVADGKAIYKVTKLRPLTVCHVAYGDSYVIPNYQIENLTKAQITNLVEGRRKLKRLFGRT